MTRGSGGGGGHHERGGVSPVTVRGVGGVTFCTVRGVGCGGGVYTFSKVCHNTVTICMH